MGLSSRVDTEKWRVIKNRDFLFLIVGRTGSGFGGRLMTIPVLWWALDEFGAGIAGLVMVGELVATVLTKPAGGVIVDRIDKRRAMVFADLFGGVATAVIAGLVFLSQLNVWLVVALFVTTSLASAIVSPATRGLIQTVLDEEEFTAGNSVYSTLMNVVALAAPAVSGVLVAFFPYWVVFAINAASFLLAAGVEVFIQSETETIDRDEDDDQSFVADARAGIDYLTSNPRLRRMIVAGLSINFFFNPLLFIGPALVKANGYGATFAGVVESIIAGGSLLGGAALLVLPEGETANAWETELFVTYAGVGAVFLLGSVFVGLTTALFLPVLYFVLFFSSVGGAVADVKNDAIVQSDADQEKIGRVFSMMRTVNNVATAAALAAAGIAVELFSASAVFFVLAAGVILTVVVLGRRHVYAYATGSVVTEDGRIVAPTSD